MNGGTDAAAATKFFNGTDAQRQEGSFI